MHYLIIFVCLTMCQTILTHPQQQQQSIEDAIQKIYGTPPTTDNTVTKRPPSRGFQNIVTPEPIFDPTISPQIFNAGTTTECTCVPYHKCDPNTNTTIADGTGADDVSDGFGVIDIRFDPESCQAVLDVCCKGENRKEESIVPPQVVPSRGGGCGIRNVNGIDFKITGNFNNEAGFGEFPWTVALVEILDDSCVCAGSLIHPKAVLTGAHCVAKFVSDPKNLKVRAGEWDTQTTKERLPYQERIASRVFVHPMYNNRSLAFDYAVIELEDPFQLDDHINTICLPSEGYVPSSKHCFASGWGKDNFGKAGKYSVILKRVELPIVPFAQCEPQLQKTKLTSKFRLHNTFICAGGEPGVDTCQGDGGAPLVCPIGNPSENRYTQAGIVAWGIGCNEPHPAAYANVGMARNWIDGQVRYVGLDTNYYTFH